MAESRQEEDSLTEVPGHAARALRGSVVAASDHFFAEAENLVRPDSGGARPGIPDSRPGAHEWVVVRLAGRASIEMVEIDTARSGRNAPGAASLTSRDGESGWSILLESAPLRPGAPHRFRLPAPVTATHVRLNIFPEGGIARFRLLGKSVIL